MGSFSFTDDLHVQAINVEKIKCPQAQVNDKT